MQSGTNFKEPTYVSSFFRLQTDGAHLFRLRGNDLLLEILEEDEIKSKGGIILATRDDQYKNSVREKEHLFAIVLMVGSGFEGESRPDIEVGNLVYVPNFSVARYTQFPGLTEPVNQRIGRCLASEVKFLYKDIESFDKAQQLLNG